MSRDGGMERVRDGSEEAREADQVALQIIYNHLFNYGSILLTAVCHNSEGSTQRLRQTPCGSCTGGGQRVSGGEDISEKRNKK